MTATEERPRTQPDLEPEREVDFGRYLDALVARWWLPVAGLIIGAAIGYFVALGGKDVYRAQATVYVGTPFGPNGANALTTIATNPNTVNQVARGQQTLQQVAQTSGMSVRELRAGVSTRPIKSGGPKTAPNQLYAVTVEGPKRGEVNAAAAAIAARIVDVTGGYAKLKINTFRNQIASDQQQLDAINAQADQVRAQLSNASQTERLTLGTLLLTIEQGRGTLEQDRLQARQLLALAEQVELPRVIQQGVAAKATARSPRNSVVVAGLIGLIAGLLAALLWEPIAARTGRE
ncbi:MAG TPA: Wzz/FepE/Etk N-terminal domain-containing protein [Gaiellaceae bacterium]|nr:Wzz/FepE/Etk N-terminal domain-containing protein [Gaiellaceae bacterium]